MPRLNDEFPLIRPGPGEIEGATIEDTSLRYDQQFRYFRLGQPRAVGIHNGRNVGRLDWGIEAVLSAGSESDGGAS